MIDEISKRIFIQNMKDGDFELTPLNFGITGDNRPVIRCRILICDGCHFKKINNCPASTGPKSPFIPIAKEEFPEYFV